MDSGLLADFSFSLDDSKYKVQSFSFLFYQSTMSNNMGLASCVLTESTCKKNMVEYLGLYIWISFYI